MKDLDILFLHPSTHILTDYGESIRYVVMPMGTFMLADILDKEGYAVKIIHTGLEYMLDPYFSIEDILKKHNPKFVGIDLQWYCHAYDAIRIAESVKMHSDAKVIIGGMTASFFAEEIMRDFDCVDYIIQGDSEIPIVKLMKLYGNDEDEVPNLYYRKNGYIKKSKKIFVADEDFLSKFSCSRLDLMENWEMYIRITHENDEPYPKPKTQGWLLVGRGCSVNCSYCGGACISHKIIFNRDRPTFRSVESVLEDLRFFKEHGVSCVYIDFDPYQDRKYYHELFRRIRVEGIDISSQFLVWSLTNREFIIDLKRTFNPAFTTITISPETGSEYVRLLNKGFYYDNDHLLRWLDILHEEKVPVELYFASGLSNESVEDFEETIKLGKKIAKEYRNVAWMVCNPLFLEPCSPRYLDPERFGVRLKFNYFMDFYSTYMSFSLGRGVKSKLGYETNYLTEEQIVMLSQRFNEVIWDLLSDRGGNGYTEGD